MNTRVLHPADQICSILKRIYDGDMTTLTGGNLSIRDDDGVVWVSPTGIDKSSLTREDIVKIFPDGNIEGKHKPTSEYRIHWEILKNRPDLKSVLHAHPPALVTMSAVHEIPDTKMLLSANMAVKNPGMSEYGMPGSMDLVRHVAYTFSQGYNAAVLKNHGVFLGSKGDLYDAFRNFEQFDFLARIQLLAQSESEVTSLSQEQIDGFLNKQRAEGAFEYGKENREGYSSRELNLRRELSILARRAYQKKLFCGSFGTISARVKENQFLISPLEKDNAYISEEDFVLADKTGWEKGKKADLFQRLHGIIYEQHHEIQSIIMAAPVYAGIYTVMNKEYEVGLIPESYGVLRNCTRIPFAEMKKGWQYIAEKVNGEKPFCILNNTGILVMGATPLMAFDKLEVAESTAMSIHYASISKKTIKAMTYEMKEEQDSQS